MDDRIVVGVFLGRAGGMLIHAVASSVSDFEVGNDQWRVHPVDVDMVQWNDDAEATAGIRRLAGYIKENDIKRIAVSSYGPFRSLKQGSSLYGNIHRTRAHKPLMGFDLGRIIRDVVGEEPILTFHTDAAACALAEAYDRNIGLDEILGYLFVSEGVGLGLVRGRQIIPNALHPEVGLIPVRYNENDPLRPINGDERIHINSSLLELFPEEEQNLYSGSLSELTENRATRLREKTVSSTESSEIRAYYLAQACLSLVSIFPPHHIVIGADIDPDNSIGKRVHSIFREFLENRIRYHQPVFEYDELNDKETEFITGYRYDHEEYLPIAAATGMCYAAAVSERLGEVRSILK